MEHSHSTIQQPRTPADMNPPNPPPRRDDDRIYRPDSWRPFNNRWMGHEQDWNQRPQPYEQRSSLRYEASRSRKRERALDPDVPTYRAYTTQGSLQDGSYVPASEYGYAQRASIPVAGASPPPPPWLLPNYSSQQYQQPQYHNQYQYQNLYQNQYQYAPFHYPPQAFLMTSPFTAINPYSTLATPRTPVFIGQNHADSRPSRPQSSNPNPRPQAPPRRRSVTPPRAVPATTTYLTQSSSPPTLTTATQPLLIILDLNGTLIHRIGRRPIRFKTRPGLHAFLKELFENYTVMVWTSSQPQTVREVLEKTFTAEERERFVAVWARDTLGLTARQYAEKVQVYKRLDKVWGDKGIAKLYLGFTENRSNETDDENATTPATTTTTAITTPPGESSAGKAKKKKKNKKQKAREAAAAAAPSGNTPWNQTNTLLIDDSVLKALAQPYNIIEIPEFASAHPPEHEEKVLDTVLRQLRVLSRYADVSCKVREWEELRRGLQQQRQERKGEAGADADLPQSHSQSDIEGFWDAQLARDEEAIRRMDGVGERDGGGGVVHTAKAETDAETDISISRQEGDDSEVRIQTHGQEWTPGLNQHEHRYSSSLSIETHTLIRSGNEGEKAENNYIKKRRNAARRDVTGLTDAITLTGGGSRSGEEDADSDGDGGVVLRVN